MDSQAKSRQFLITKENYPAFKAKQLEARARRQAIRDKAKAVADAIANSTPAAITARLEVQAVAIHEAILATITDQGRVKPDRVKLWLDCQAKILSQLRNSPEPDRKRPGRRPEVGPVRPVLPESSQTANEAGLDPGTARITASPEPRQDGEAEPEGRLDPGPVQTPAEGSLEAGLDPGEL